MARQPATTGSPLALVGNLSHAEAHQTPQNVKYHGAKLDGTTLDDAAVAAAAAAVGNNGTLLFPQGNCRLSTGLIQTLGASTAPKIVGEGWGSKITFTSTTGTLFDITGVSNGYAPIIFEDIYLLGSGGTSTGIKLTGAGTGVMAQLRGVRVEGFGTNILGATNALEVDLFGCLIVGAVADGLKLDGTTTWRVWGGAIRSNVNGVHLTNGCTTCEFHTVIESNTSNGMLIDGAVNQVGHKIYGHFENNVTGIKSLLTGGAKFYEGTIDAHIANAGTGVTGIDLDTAQGIVIFGDYPDNAPIQIRSGADRTSGIVSRPVVTNNGTATNIWMYNNTNWQRVVTPQGATASRPTAAQLGAGGEWFDTSKGRMLRSDGTNLGLIPWSRVTTQTQTGGGTLTPNYANGDAINVNVTDGTAFTMGYPSNLDTAFGGQILVLEVSNSSGGVMGAITWHANYHWAGGAAPAVPTAGNRHLLMFLSAASGTTLHEISRSLNVPI